jgi:hypothetical protein
LSSARETRRPFGSSTGSLEITAGSPGRTIERASSPLLAPMSAKSSSRSSGGGVSPFFCLRRGRSTTPVTTPFRVLISIRCASRTSGDQPPIGRK